VLLHRRLAGWWRPLFEHHPLAGVLANAHGEGDARGPREHMRNSKTNCRSTPARSQEFAHSSRITWALAFLASSFVLASSARPTALLPMPRPVDRMAASAPSTAVNATSICYVGYIMDRPRDAP